MNYYRFHMGDYIRSTAHLSNEEDLTYRRLLDFYYDNEGPIPDETQMVSRRLRLDNQMVINILNEFFLLGENGWENNRANMEIAKYQSKKAQNQEVGKLGGRPKKTQMVSKRNPDVTQRKPKHNPNQQPITNNQQPILNNPFPLSMEASFETFWKAYPNKTGKGAARKSFYHLKPSVELVGVMLFGIERSKKSDQWRKDNGQYIPNPATWLNQSRWEDEPLSLPPEPQKTGRPKINFSEE